MLFGGEDDDDNDFAPSTGSKLSSLFGGPTSKSSNLKYVAPKQPRSDSTGNAGERGNSAGQPSQVQSQAPAVLLAAPVHAYIYVNDVAQSQGRAMCCLLGNLAEKNFQLLVYRSKQDHLTRARIHQQFTFTVLPNNYASFSDDQKRTWSIMIDTGQYADFVTQVGICRALTLLPVNSGQYLTQDVTTGDGPGLREGDHAQLSYSTWKINANGKKGEQVEEPKSSHRIKLKEGSVTWEMKLLEMQKNGRRLIFMQSVKDSNSIIFFDVVVERFKQKGGGDLSGRSTPQVDLQHHHRDISNSNRSLNMLPEDLESGNVNEVGPPSKAALVSRMARMGHALLPSSAVSSRHPATDSESEVEEITRRRKQRYSDDSVSGSVEEFEATPAVRMRAHSTRSDSSKPDPAPRPSNLSHPPQQLVVYQSPWQQPALLPPGYSAIQTGSQPPVASAPTSDPTMSLLFSETRSQNTELKISVSKMSDKIDGLSTKIEKMEQQLKQQEGTSSHSAIVPAMSMTPQFNYLHPSNSVDAQAILAQITTLVSDNESMKARLEDKEKKITSLNESVTQLLEKNQKLLEEKTDMLIAKQESGSTVSLSEVLVLREEKASINAQLSIAQGQLASVKEEVLESKKLTDKQDEEIRTLRLQVQEEHTKRTELQCVADTQKEKEHELDLILKERESEKQRLEALLDDNETQKKLAGSEMSELVNKRKELEERLCSAESERDAIKEKLKIALQQMEEKTKVDESSASKDTVHQLQEDVKFKSAKIDLLEQELGELRNDHAEIKQQLEQQSSEYQEQIQRLESEKEVLKNATNNEKSTTNSDEVVGTVKKVMNSVFRTLKPQFADDEAYTGTAIMQTLLAVIRETTLQLLEDIDSKGSSVDIASKSENASSSEEKKGNGVNDVGILPSIKGIPSPETISSSVEKPSIENIPVNSKTDCRSSEDRDEVVNSEILEERRVADIGVLREDVEGSNCDKEVENEECENRTEVSSSEGEYTDASDRQYSPNSSVSSSGSVSYDCEETINTVSLDSGTEKDISVSMVQEISDVDKSSVQHADENTEPKPPVINMEDTQGVTVANEKSDSSRDSSLDRAWRPQPPPPPLFSDEDEDDDDWLS